MRPSESRNLGEISQTARGIWQIFRKKLWDHNYYAAATLNKLATATRVSDSVNML